MSKVLDNYDSKMITILAQQSSLKAFLQMDFHSTSSCIANTEQGHEKKFHPLMGVESKTSDVR